MSTLKEVLKSIPGETVVAIGAKSGYIFVEKAEMFARLEPKMSQDARDGFKISLDRADEHIKIMLKGIPAYKPAKYLDKMAYANKMADIAKSLKQYLGYSKKIGDYIENWKNFIDREVKKVDKTKIYGVTQILIEGYEEGRFWTQEEFDEYLKKEAAA
jgi:hypothetical protein